MAERFAVADELTCYYDRPAEPANVHVEVRVAGRLDEAVLRGSVRAVLAAEPRLRARRLAASTWHRSYRWEFPAAPDADPVRVVICSSEADLVAHRDAFLSRSPSLDQSPPLLLLLARGPADDRLILNAHHAAFDGLSCFRLLGRVAAEYGAGAAKVSPGDPVCGAASRSPAGIAAPADFSVPGGQRSVSGGQRAVGAQTGKRPTRKAAGRSGRIARIAAGQGLDRAGSEPGYGAYLLAWDGLPATGWLRAADRSVNDLLIAALMITIAEWNERYGGRGSQIRITMPIGERGQAGESGDWANRSRLTAVTARVPAVVSSDDLLSEVARQTRYAKEHPGPQVDLVSRALVAVPVPVLVKDKVLRAALRIAGPVLCDTSLVSNLGVVAAPAFGPLTATEMWFSTSAHMPRGLSVGAVTVGSRLLLTFRYRRALFTRASAAEFAGRYGQVLDRFARREVPVS